MNVWVGVGCEEEIPFCGNIFTKAMSSSSSASSLMRATFRLESGCSVSVSVESKTGYWDWELEGALLTSTESVIIS